MAQSITHFENRVASDAPRLFAFSKMNSKEQRNFIQRRLENIDPTELAGIVRAIYGHPHDKGRKRSNSHSERRGQ